MSPEPTSTSPEPQHPGGQGRDHLLAVVLIAGQADPDPDAIADAVRAHTGRTRVLDRRDSAFLLAHEDLTHPLTTQDGRTQQVPIATMVATGTRPGRDDVDTSQSWLFPEAGAAVARATSSVLVREVMGGPHPGATRARVFSGVVSAVVGATEAVAVWNPHSGGVTAPDQALGQALGTLVNVRLFADPHTSGLVHAETTGLDVLGLPDLALKVRAGDPSMHVMGLYEVAAWLIERGDVIRDGAVLRVLPEEPWTVTRARGGNPERDLLVLDDGSADSAE